jgi:CubicO group peptidase (beta-lactamase class C family)
VSLERVADPIDVGFAPERLDRLNRHFDGYVDDGRLAGYLLSIARHGEVAHLRTYGLADREAGRAVDARTVWRLHSMTKVVTAVAVLMLYENGQLQLTDPIERFLPAFAEPRVYVDADTTRPANGPIRVWQLLSHTSGLSYPLFDANPVDALYRAAGLGSTSEGSSLTEVVDRYGSLPLLFDPGTRWYYSVASLILGRLIEVVSGQELDAFLAERIFGPLGMPDTGFTLAKDQLHRAAAMYGPDAAGQAVPIPSPSMAQRPSVLSGSGGLVSSAADFHRFIEMLRQRGEHDGVRLLAPRTVDLLAGNHVPGGADVASFSSWGAEEWTGIGFGFGVQVTLDPVRRKLAGSVGEFGFMGASGTVFWIDPVADLTVQFMAQLRPPAITHSIQSQLRQLVYQALID